jgi:S-formylglutathione hydrolase FrmB
MNHNTTSGIFCARLFAAARILAFALALSALPAWAQVSAGSATVSIERIKVHSPAVAGNLEGNPADREVFVILPASYATATDRRYPVLYFLHGYNNSAQDIMDWIKIGEGTQKAAAAGAPEMIVVVPDTNSKHGGAMYSNSVTVGGFEDFIVRDLVSYVDSHYRTIAKRESRGLGGHSMGGYGTLRIGMRNSDVFSSLYAMSPCCLPPRTMEPDMGKAIEAKTPEEVAKGDFMIKATYAVAAAWSPAPEKPPFFVDLPTRNGELQPLVIAKWAANSPIAMVPQYASNLKSLDGIAVDVGDEDFMLKEILAMHEELERFGVKHDWTIYQGDHGNRIAQRYQELVVPFFGKHLKGE